MKNSGFSRLWFFLILFAVIVVAHVVVLRWVVKSDSAKTDLPLPDAPAAVQPSPAAAVQPAEEKATADNSKTVAAPAEEKKSPSLWSRLFGGKKSTPAPVAETVKPAPKPRFRHRVPSGNPFFGERLDYSKAMHGNALEKYVPGAKDAGTGIVADMDTRRVLWEKNPGKAVPVASMVKMMTMLLTAEEMERNEALTLDSKVTITRAVMQVKRTGILWLSPGEVFPLRSLLLGVAVKSANDAATQIAEVVGGSVDSFVGRLNERAKELKLSSLEFYNPCGLPDKRGRNAVGSAADMLLLGERLLEYPFLLEMCSTLKGSIREGAKETIFVNTNRLINPHYPGVDGLKTGFINKSGFCLTFSVLRDGRRIMGCVTGFKTSRDRDRFCRRLIDWAYKQPLQ